jgi:hypothetical protein
VRLVRRDFARPSGSVPLGGTARAGQIPPAFVTGTASAGAAFSSM